MASIKGWKSPAVVRVAMDCRRDHVRQHRRRSDGGLPLDWYVVLAKAEAAGVSAEDIADAIAPNFLFPDIV